MLDWICFPEILMIVICHLTNVRVNVTVVVVMVLKSSPEDPVLIITESVFLLSVLFLADRCFLWSMDEQDMTDQNRQLTEQDMRTEIQIKQMTCVSLPPVIFIFKIICWIHHCLNVFGTRPVWDQSVRTSHVLSLKIHIQTVLSVVKMFILWKSF